MKLRILGGIIVTLGLSCALMAGSFEGNVRIFTMLPTLDAPLAVDPAIPRNFVALSKDGTFDRNEWIYWGPKEVVEAYFQDQSTLKQSILRVRASETVKQISADKFSVENDELCKLMAPMGLKRLFDVRMKWGKYPIYAVTAEFQKKWLYTAWVGLSDPQGSTLMFELVYPGTKPTNEQFELWDVFLDKTKILSDPVYSQGFNAVYAQGQTNVMLYGQSLSFIAEQRYTDKLIQVVVDAKKSGFTPILDTVYFSYIMPDPNCGGPGAKVYLSLVRKEGEKETVFTHMIPVLMKQVDSFSVEAESAKKNGAIVYEQQLPCMLKEYLK